MFSSDFSHYKNCNELSHSVNREEFQQ